MIGKVDERAQVMGPQLFPVAAIVAILGVIVVADVVQELEAVVDIGAAIGTLTMIATGLAMIALDRLWRRWSA